MKKRILAMLLAVVMVAACLPVSVLAEGEQTTDHIHCECGKQKTLNATCESCGTKAVEWTGADALPTGSGHYYLTKSVSAQLVEYGPGVAVSICLHGKDITSTKGERILTATAGGAQVIITDCAETQGTITGGTVNKYGSALRVNYGSTLTMYGGKITGNTAPSTGDGTVYVGEGTATLAGGAFYMYGGEISGNTARRGSGVFVANPGTTKKPGSAHILGGKITDNTGTGTGGTKGGAGILAFGPVEIGGSAQIYGNKAQEGPADIYLRNSGYPGALVVSATVPLEAGASVSYGSDTEASEDPANLTSISGTPAEWSCSWVDYNGQTVSYVNGKFVLGHYHGDQKYEPVSTNAALRDTAGNIYLTQDLKLGGPQTWKVSKNLCLNGHSITAKAGNRVFSTENASKVTIKIQDCSAYTDENGVYHAGSLTGGDNLSGGGGAFSVATGSTVYLQGGKLTGNASQVAGGAVMITGTLYVEGGEISGNAAKAADGTLKNGGAIFMNGGAKLYISGGKITGNQAAKGGAIYSNASNVLFDISGGTITGNTSNEAGAVHAGPNVTVKLSGEPIITGNTLSGNAANLYLAGTNTLEVGTMGTNAKVGISAEAAGRAISGACSDYSEHFTSDNDAYKVFYQDGALFLGTPITHKHNVCGDASCSDHAQEGFAEWTSTSTLPESGAYYLTEDVVLTKQASLDNANVILCLNGHTVSVKEGANLRFYYLKGNSQLTITDCAATPGTMTGATRSAIMTENAAASAPVISLYAGNLTGNVGESGGGAVLLQGKAVFNMYGGSLTGNSTAGALGGGAVSQYSKDTVFNMYGGEISGNTAAKKDETSGGTGGAVYARGTVNLYGGTITGNTAGRMGGGIYLDTQAKDSILAGAVTVTGNSANGKKSNLHIAGSQLLQIGELSADAQVGISGAPAFQTISSPCSDYSQQVTSDANGYEVIYKDGALYLDAQSGHSHCLCGGVAAGCDHKSMKFGPWEETDRLPSAGNYYLTADVVLTGEASISGNLNLCLNGHTVTAAKDKRILSTPKDAGVTLTIGDCADKPGKLTGGADISTAGAGAVFIRSGNTLKLFAGEITGNTSVTAGGAIVIAGGAKLEMHGGSVSGNTAVSADGKTFKNGGGIFLNAGSEFTMTGGTVANNRGASGGGIYANNAKLTVSGGTVDANKGNMGGGIYCTGTTTLEMRGGTVSGNSSATNGGGIYMATGTQLTMTGGTVSGNHSDKNGGGLYILKQTVTLNGTISGNSATEGGGAYCNGANVTLGNVTVSGNTATNGAGVYANTTGNETDGLFPAAVVIGEGATVTGNKATTNGGGVVISGTDAKLTVKAGQVTKNSAKNAGGVLLLGSCSMELTGGKIANNSANSGGGIYASSNSTLTMTGGSVSGNSTVKNAGGVYLLRSKAALKGGTISGNSAESGAGVYAAGAKVTLSGTTISGNTAKKNGGGMMMLTSTVTKNGVKTVHDSTVDMVGGIITGNEAINAGGVLVQAKGAVFNMKGGSVSGNKATSSGGGFYISTNGTFNMTGGAIEKNESKNGGGMWTVKATVTFTGGKVCNNAITTSGGGVVAGNHSTVLIQNTEIYGNTSKAAAGLLCQGGATMTVENCKVYGNQSTALGGGLYVSTNSFAIIKDTHFYDNHAGSNGGAMFCNQKGDLQVDGALIENNLADAGGGGVFNRGKTVVKNSQIRGNTAKDSGGGMGSYKMSHAGGMFVENTTVTDNTAGLQGGGIYFSLGCVGGVTNVTITGNKAAAEGGALWAMEDLSIDGLTATGNQSGGEGYAVYLNDSNYDGESYVAGVMKMKGDVIVKDNQGGDMYLGEDTTISIPGGIIGEKTHINITLSSGVLTQKVFGQYHYEGGDRVYTITYGDRSMTDPEAVPGSEAAQEESDTGDMLLYVGVGVFALAVIAVVILLLGKKKKNAKEPAGE